MRSKCGKNKKVAQEVQLSVTLISNQILMSYVIYNCMDTQRHGTYLFWNDLPCNVINCHDSPNINKFKLRLKNHMNIY